jgi:hypothetical protein
MGVEGRFSDQVVDLKGEIFLAKMSNLPYAE